VTDLIPLFVLALALLTVLVHVRRYAEREATPAQAGRVKWFVVAFLVWMVALRGLATEVSHGCAVDRHALGARTGWFPNFFECSPQLLSGGPAEIFLFFWAWAPFALTAAFCVRHLLRLAGRPHRDSKES
jgi:hypothetical protein